MYSVKELNERAGDTYEKIHFFEKHPSLFTIISTIIFSASSTIIALTAYIYQKKILSYWNVPVEYASQVNGSRAFFIVVINILYIIIYSILIYNLESYFEKLLLHFTLKKGIKRLQKKNKKFSENEKYNCLKQQINHARNEINKRKLRIGAKTFMVIIISYIILYAMLCLFQTVSSINGKTEWKSIAFGLPFIFIISFLVLFLFEMSRCNKRYGLKNIKKEVSECNDATECANLASRINEYDAIIHDGMEKKKTSLKYSDSEINLFFEKIVAGIISFVVIIFLLCVTPNTQKNFWIYMDSEGTQYAVVYQNSEHAILKKAEVCDKTITIYLNCQIILDCEGEMLEYMEFENVKKIPEQK